MLLIRERTKMKTKDSNNSKTFSPTEDKVEIEFVEGLGEKVIPTIKLTKSKNGKTGTATFLFLFPEIFFHLQTNLGKNIPIEKMSLHSRTKKKIITKDLLVLFSNGKPYAIKAILILKNPKEWFEFLSFMRQYSNQVGLFFAQTENSLNHQNNIEREKEEKYC
jgi:photosystem II protein